MFVLCVDVGCWALWSCGAVQLFHDEGLDLLTAAPTLFIQFISSQTLIHFLFGRGGGTTLHLSIECWFYQVEMLIGGLVGVSILWVPF